ncbi:MAG: hypothetical protein V1926_06470 [Candidatus Peregrinibacteria bacterium]
MHKTVSHSGKLPTLLGHTLLLLLILLPGTAGASSWNPTLLVSTEAFQTIDDSDTAANVVLKFGDTLKESLTYNRSSGRFEFSRPIFVGGGITATGSLSVKQGMSGSALRVDRNADVWGNLSVSGATVIDGSLSASGTLSTEGTVRFQNATDSMTAFQVLDQDGGNPVLNIDTDNEYVGIGTVGPGAPLDVERAYAGPTNIAKFMNSSANQGTFNYIGQSLDTGRSLGYGFQDNSDGSSGYGWLSVYGDDPAQGTGLIVKKGGNVGIGTAAPDTKLEVEGTMSGHSLKFSNSLSGSGSVRIRTNTNSTTAFQVLGSAEENPIFNIDTKNGAVGIGTASPSANLHIHGDTTADLILDKSSGNTFAVRQDSNADFVLKDDTNAVNMMYYRPAGNEPSSRLSIYDDKLVIKSSGNVGIGTTAPETKLEVAGTMSGRSLQVTGTGAAPLIYTNTTTGNVGIGTTSPNVKLVTTGTSTVANGVPITRITTGTGASTDESLEIGVYDGSYSWLQAIKQGTGVRPLLLNPGGGNVGIGTTAPATLLDIFDNNRVVNGALLKLHQGTGGSQGGVDFYSDINTADNRNWALIPNHIAYGDFDIATSQALFGDPHVTYNSRLYIDKAGNVGIGTTNPLGKLHVTGGKLYLDTDATSSTYVDSIIIRGASDTNQQMALGYDTTNNRGTIQVIKQGDDVKPLLLQPYGGNIGIGTTGPDRKLDILDGSGNPQARLTYTDGTVYTDLETDVNGTFWMKPVGSSIGLAGNIINWTWDVPGAATTSQTASMNFDPIYSDPTGRTVTAKIDFNRPSTTNGEYPGLISFWTRTHGAALAERMRIDNLGNVGIGTTAPGAYKLNVAGDMIISADGFLNSYVVQGRPADGILHVRAQSTATLYLNYGAGADMQYFGGGTSALMTWKAGGNVGVGTTAPETKLEVSGTASGDVLHAQKSLTSSGTFKVTQSAAAGSGAVAVYQRANATGAIIGSLATTQPLLALDSSLGNSAAAPHILFGYKGTFDTKLYRSAANTLQTSGALRAGGLIAVTNPQGTTSAPTRSNEGEFAFAYVAGTNRLYARVNGTNVYWNADGTGDFSEFFLKSSKAENLSPGTVVQYMPDALLPGVSLSGGDVEENVIGVVSAGGTRNNDDESGSRGDDPDYVNVGLLGHLPVKVSLQNGPIVTGDFLVPSSTPGTAMKALSSGNVIGTALEPYSAVTASGMILAYINPHYAMIGKTPSFGSNGFMGIGTRNPRYALDVQLGSKVNSSGGYLTNGSDYAEYFSNEEIIPVGSPVGMNGVTGNVRVYRNGDEFIGIASAGKGYVGNGNADIEQNPRYTLVGLLGQLDFRPELVTIEKRIVYTKDKTKIGLLLQNGKVLMR